MSENTIRRRPTGDSAKNGSIEDRLAYALISVLGEYVPCLKDGHHVPARYDPPDLAVEAIAEYTGAHPEDVAKAFAWRIDCNDIP